MSLISNLRDLAFVSSTPVDKIVNVWEGSYNKSTQTTTRTGGIGSIYVYPINHGFTRPVFTNLLWSEDNVTWLDGGATITGGNSAIAFSDSTNAYIATNNNSGTLYYKLIATWIDSYDTTDPLVDSYGAPNKTLAFDSRLNYQKIHDQNSTTYAAGTFGSSQTVSIPHTLNYIPNAKAWFEPISGEVWPLNAGGLSNPFLYDFAQDEAVMLIYNNRVDVTVSRSSNAIRKIWYKVYVDE